KRKLLMKRFRLWVGMGISIICLALALRGVDFEGLGQALQSVRWPYLVLAFSALLLAVWLRAVRWRVLFYPQTGLSLSTLFSIINIGYLFINVLPARVGELVRAYLAGEVLGTGAPRALSTIVLERALDVLTVVLLLLGLAPFVPLPPWAVRAGLLAGAGAVVMIVVMIVIALNRERGVQLGEWLGRWAPERFRVPFTAAWASLIDGFAVVREPGQFLRVVLLSMAIWAISAVVNYCVLVGFALPAPPTAAVLVLCIAALGMVIPSSPGYIGVFEYLVVLTLSLFGIDKELALSYGLVLHGVNYVGLSLLGVVGLWKESLSYADVRGKMQKVPMDEEVGASS
ncbi:MAG: lysylphosphatidylglycerol synthase transmembrane domain-containing protein, partial [Chloroflexota bacterium]